MSIFSTLYSLLLAYIVAALVFWGISLYKQSERIYEQEMIHLRTQVDSVAYPQKFVNAKHEFEDKRIRRIKQYSGEGSTFLLIILIGAGVVYSSYRRGNRLSQQQSNFMLSVTHELKSPIAAMKLNLQTLERHKLDEEKRHLLIGKCITESNRLNDLCNNILMASQMEGKQHKAVFERLNFSEMIETITLAYSQRYPERIIGNLQAKNAVIQADKLMLQMAVNNLIENAVKYSSGEITIHSFTRKRQLYFRVCDNGTGIPDAEKPKIFRKFYRIGNENTRVAKGTGLGLYLTEKIVHQHKGRISVKDNKPSGAIFEIEIPLL
ncbi:MAG TPA: HAMP domain-containing sensor histidine kinase [Flavipsychrobacter sp.]|nr:HAMP domain-containing sensor histidine kinase [Flavipsychrobacter sp.]